MKHDPDSFDDEPMPQFNSLSKTGNQNNVTDLKSSISRSGLSRAINKADDDDCFVDEDTMMSTPLQLISRDKAMKLDSGLLRQNLPAVSL